MNTINEEDEVLNQCFGTMDKYYLTSTPLMNKGNTADSKSSRRHDNNFDCTMRSLHSIGSSLPRYNSFKKPRSEADRSLASLPRYRRMRSTFLFVFS